MKIRIPKKIKRSYSNYSKKYYHYELVEIKKHIVIYKCVETGNIETFSKNEFVVNEE